MKPRLPLLLLSLIAASASAAETTPAPAATTPVAPTTAPAATSGKSTMAPARGNGGGGRRNAPSSASTSSDGGFDNFSLITERNIFNAYRTPGRRNREEAPTPRTDTITLVGTMESDKGLRAFFDGSEAAYRKALHVGDSVDKFKVTKIEPKVIEVEHDGKTMAVSVGQQLRRPEGGDWILTADVQPRAGIMASPARPDPTAAPEISAGMSDIEKQMRERRAKALNKN